MQSLTTTSPLAPSIEPSSVYRLRDVDEASAIHGGTRTGYVYARDGHPNADRLATRLAALERAPSAWVFASGMAAIASVALDLLRAGDRAVVASTMYGRTMDLFLRRLPSLGVATRSIDIHDPRAVDDALADRPRLLFVETISNPLLRVTPIDDLARKVRGTATTLVVDGTFAPPPMLRPIEMGADLVIHSLTKILSGHSDVTAGSVAGAKEFIDRVRQTASTMGGVASPFDCWLTERGLSTYLLRLERGCENALSLASALAAHPKTQRVIYPGLSAHPDHEWLRTHSDRFGTLLCLELAGGRPAVNRFFRHLETIPFCPSLGDVKTTVSHPASTSHQGLSAEARQALGITEGLVRMSVGIEPVDELLRDIRAALDALE